MTVMAEAPQTSFYLSGFNDETGASEPNTLVYTPSEDPDDLEADEDEGIYRYIINEFHVESCANGFYVVGSEGLRLGYNKDNLMGLENEISDMATMLGLIDGGPAVNCTLTPGDYKVILASMYNEDETGYDWNIMFQSLNGEAELSYYILGFNGDYEPSQANMFVREEIEEEGETFVMYSYPRFLIENCENGFTVGTSNGGSLGLDPAFASMSSEVTEESPMAFLAEGGDPVKCQLAPGYYALSFTSTGAMSMISFIRCEDQTPADESEYYLVGFDGTTTVSDNVKFTRKVETDEYEDEDSGEMVTSTTIVYELEKIALSECPDGFTITTADGGFSYGLNSQFAAMLGDTITEDNPFGFLGIYGEPFKWNMPKGEYTVRFTCNGANGGSVSFLPYDDSAVDGIEADDKTTPVFYNLQGVRVTNPDKGIFIKKTGNKTVKIIK